MLDQDTINKIKSSSISESDAVSFVESSPNHKILYRVPERRVVGNQTEGQTLHYGAVIDLETMGLDHTKDAILEIGIALFSFTSLDGLIEVTETYNGLQDPKCPIPPEITEITGITDADVSGQAIDWESLLPWFQKVDLIICHKSFDRNFLELKTLENISSIVKRMAFGCSMRDVDWRSRGYIGMQLQASSCKYSWSEH